MPHTDTTIENIVELLAAGDMQAVNAIFARAHPADIADALEQITPANRPVAWQQIPEDASGKVLAELTDGVFRDLVNEIDEAQIVESIKQLDIDDIADLIPDLPEKVLSDILHAVDIETRKSLGEVLLYPEDSAGGLMNIDATVVRDNCSLEVALRFIRLCCAVLDVG